MISYLNYPSGDLVRPVNEKLSVVHSMENFNVRLRIQGKEMLHLRSSDKRFLGPVPIMYVGTGDGSESVGVDGPVPVQDRPSSAKGIYLPALVQKDVEIMGMEYFPPEPRPVIAGPDIGTLVIA